MIIREMLIRLLNNKELGYKELVQLPISDKRYVISKLSNLTGNLTRDELAELVVYSLQLLEMKFSCNKNTGDIERDLNDCIDIACLKIHFNLRSDNYDE